MKILTRSEYDQKKSKKIYGKADCPICPLDINSEEVIWVGKSWKLIYNISPYTGTKEHIMAIPNDHICYFRDLKSEHMLEFPDLYDQVEKFYGDGDYFSFTRESFGNRTVEHYHMHFLPGKMQDIYLRKMLKDQGFPIETEI